MIKEQLESALNGLPLSLRSVNSKVFRIAWIDDKYQFYLKLKHK